ncbi:hypothetical protein [Ramlibacter alkalitolerans]|uniref:Uncharacterized protein n=1 Tax=Ramlibacter alkalitolerans TaxID=2039631 RepID=A0ABS1JVX4_9BURK|nr:hypothetical protein [Ramlibacter alkalitolerans]MBL0427695.1 hypothetical protein [Ramlibacter alkalitolerans]
METNTMGYKKLFAIGAPVASDEALNRAQPGRVFAAAHLALTIALVAPVLALGWFGVNIVAAVLGATLQGASIDALAASAVNTWFVAAVSYLLVSSVGTWMAEKRSTFAPMAECDAKEVLKACESDPALTAHITGVVRARKLRGGDAMATLRYRDQLATVRRHEKRQAAKQRRKRMRKAHPALDTLHSLGAAFEPRTDA